MLAGWLLLSRLLLCSGVDEWHCPNSAALLASPGVPGGEQKHWSRFASETLATTRQLPEKVFHIKNFSQLRFRFPKSTRGEHYLEWQTIVQSLNGTDLLPEPFYLPFVKPGKLCDLEISTPLFVYRGFSPEAFQFGHILHDVLPMIVWVATRYPGVQIAILRDVKGTLESFLQWLDADLAQMVTLVPSGAAVCAMNDVLMMIPGEEVLRPEQLRIPALMTSLRGFVFQRKQLQQVDKVIYYQRIRGATSHGRLFSEADSMQLVNLARGALRAQNKSDQIVVFNGTQNGVPMTFEEQYRLFSSAYLAFGPHGTGLSNVLWMQATDCLSRPAVIEFMCSLDTSKMRGCFVQVGKRKLPRPMTYWRLHGGAPWVRYFIVWLLRHKEDAHLVRVDLPGFEMALAQALQPGDDMI
ncbi:unnamed protein product [Effrenium voratum]|nr:unnamed protein product [Effrenium voratum]